MSWCTDQATVRLSKMRTLYDEAWEGLTGRFPKCTAISRIASALAGRGDIDDYVVFIQLRPNELAFRQHGKACCLQPHP